MTSPLIGPDDLAPRLDDPSWLVVDCRYDLKDLEAGRRAYRESHVAGAVYADCLHDLSGPPVTDRGRHPLPTPGALERTFSRLGVGPATTVVGYDASGGPYAARLWWLLQYAGHDRALALDGGWQAWHAAGGPVRAGEESREATTFRARPRRERVVTADAVPAQRRLVDAREAVRFRGEQEPIDAVAGRIPGAVNRPWKENLEPDGRFKPPAVLRAAFEQALAGTPADGAAVYCGSGVTACHDVLAMVVAGLPMPKLYAGSWSDWISDPGRPVSTGDDPPSDRPSGPPPNAPRPR